MNPFQNERKGVVGSILAVFVLVVSCQNPTAAERNKEGILGSWTLSSTTVTATKTTTPAAGQGLGTYTFSFDSDHTFWAFISTSLVTGTWKSSNGYYYITPEGWVVAPPGTYPYVATQPGAQLSVTFVPGTIYNYDRND